MEDNEMTSEVSGMNQKLKYRDILYNDQQLGPFPMHLLKQVERPTNKIVGPIERRDPRESVFGKNASGAHGKEMQKEFSRMI